MSTSIKIQNGEVSVRRVGPDPTSSARDLYHVTVKVDGIETYSGPEMGVLRGQDALTAAVDWLSMAGCWGEEGYLFNEATDEWAESNADYIRELFIYDEETDEVIGLK